MKTAALRKLQPRKQRLRHIEIETRRWSTYVDTLLRAFDSQPQLPPALSARMTGLRHKRDTVLTKLEALRLHRGSRRARAWREFQGARRELRDAWRLVLTLLQREGLFIH